MRFPAFHPATWSHSWSIDVKSDAMYLFLLILMCLHAGIRSANSCEDSPLLARASFLFCSKLAIWLVPLQFHTHNWIFPAWLWTCHPSFWNRRSSQVPLVRSGYFATEEKPLEIFKCRPDAWCPGGRPGLLSFVFVCVLDSVVPDWKGSNSSVSWGLYHVNPKQSVKDDDGWLAMFGWTTISIRFPCKDLESSNWNNHF